MQSVVQIYGTCDECRTGRAPSADVEGHTDLVFARDALRIAIATERSGLDFYTRAARVTRDARGRKVFHDLALEEKEHLGKLEDRYAELLLRDPQLVAVDGDLVPDKINSLGREIERLRQPQTHSREDHYQGTIADPRWSLEGASASETLDFLEREG